MADEDLQPIVDAMKELIQDNTVPKNVKVRLGSLIEVFNEKSELSIKINKALQELGIKTIKQLRTTPVKTLSLVFKNQADDSACLQGKTG